MKKATLIFLLFSAVSVFSQNGDVTLKADGQAKSNRPTVYLEYVCQDNKKIHLRMFNNTVWTIAVNSDELYYKTGKSVTLANGKEYYALPNDKEISLQYRVDKFALPTENVKIPKISYLDSASTNWIASGDSVLFSVPSQYLKENLQIFVRFNYEWEVTKNGSIVSGPEHRVSFRGIDIPDKTIGCAN